MQALAEKKQADQILASDQAQYRAGGIPQTDLINAQAAAESSTAKVRELEASLAVDALPAREQQIKAQLSQVAADRASLADATWKLQQKEIASPRRGLVFDTLYREGEWVAAGNPVVELLPPENLEIRFFVPESVVGKLRVGQSIRVNCDGCSADIGATITFISPQNEYTPPVIYSNENRSKLVFMVIAKPSVQKRIRCCIRASLWRSHCNDGRIQPGIRHRRAGPEQALRRQARRQRCFAARAPRRDLRLPRAERQRQDDVDPHDVRTCSSPTPAAEPAWATTFCATARRSSATSAT